MEKYISKFKSIVLSVKPWYLSLDKKKKSILWLYVVCAFALFIGTGYIIFSSVLQADKFESQVKLQNYLTKTEDLNKEYKKLSKERDTVSIEEARKEIEIDFDGAINDLKTNTDILNEIKLPISDPISE
ncbi:hypothetical protein KBD45_04580 [Candidatus Dojkabacteria bacterium]|nr:hypothetical protein [Candidatus Dojkabacteria bacterium]